MGAATQAGRWEASQPPSRPCGRTKDPRTQDLRTAARVKKGLARCASPFFFAWHRFGLPLRPKYRARTEAILMQLCKVQLRNGEIRVGLVADGSARLLTATSLSDVLHADDPARAANSLLASAAPVPLADLTLLAPVD